MSGYGFDIMADKPFKLKSEMKRNILFTALIGLLFLGACKPTEKGYKSAYDAALGKRQASMAEIDANIPTGALQQVDGAQLKEVDGVKVYVMNQRIKPAETVMELPSPYNVAVGCYKMITNCRSQSENLLFEGFHSFPAQDAEGLYYTIAGSFDNLSEAVKFYKEYQEGKGRVYVGLPDAPVIIYSPK